MASLGFFKWFTTKRILHNWNDWNSLSKSPIYTVGLLQHKSLYISSWKVNFYLKTSYFRRVWTVRSIFKVKWQYFLPSKYRVWFYDLLFELAIAEISCIISSFVRLAYKCAVMLVWFVVFVNVICALIHFVLPYNWL